MTTASQASVDASYELTDGIEFDAVVSDAYFGYDTKYKNGEQLLFIVELLKDDGEERSQFYTMGNNWEPNDDGSAVTPLNPRKVRFNKQSGYGQLLDSALEAGAGPAFKSVGAATEAAIWKGRAFTFTNKEFSGKIQGEDRTWTRLLISEFHPDGIEGIDGPAPANAVSADEKRAAIRGELRAIANSCEDFGQFAERALVEVDGVENDTYWTDQLLNDALYLELRKG